MTGGDHSSNNTPVKEEQNQHNTPLHITAHSISNSANTDNMNDNKHNAHALGKSSQGLHPPENGNSNEFGLSPQNYFDSNWASSLLMDPNSDILYNMDFDSQENLTTANSMIYHSNTPTETPGINMKLGLAPSQPTINGVVPLEHQVPQISRPASNFAPKSQQEYIQAQQSIPPQQQNIPPHQQNLPPQQQNLPPQQQNLPPQQQNLPPQQQNLPPQQQNLPRRQQNIPPAQQTKSTKQRRPCDHCRRRKTKCVIIPNTNNCAQCESKSLTCTYVGLALKRKTGYDSDGDSKRLKTTNEKTRENKLGNEQTNQVMGPIQVDRSTIVAPNVPIRDVAPVRDYSSINNSLLQKTLSLQFPRSSFYVGPTSYLYDINLLNLIIDSQNNANGTISNKGNTSNNGSGKIEQVNLSNSTSLRKVGDNAQFILKDDQSPRSYQNMSNDVDTVEKFVAPHGQILIDLYFRIIHPSYPILHKKVFLEKYSRTHREFSAPLLAAVYALAIQWWEYDPQLNKFPKPNVDLILKVGLNNYLLEILKRPKLSAVQAGLLLLQCKHIIQSSNEQDTAVKNSANTNSPALTSDSHYSDWVLCSQVITLAEELGLGLNCKNWKLPKWERGLRKRLAWAVYMEDKWLSLKNSRPSHINELNWVVVSLIDEDFPEKHGDGDLKEGSSDIDNGKKIFMNLINLTMILSDILDKFYSMKAMAEINDIAQVLQIAKPLQLRLRNWYHSLPVDLQMSSVQPRKLCSNGYLQLAYFATELTLHRKIITTIFVQSLAGNPPPKELVGVCRTAAKTRLSASIEFVRDLKPEHMHSFWHSSSSSNFTLICTFAAILYMTSSNKEESDFYKDQIFNYRWILKISSKGFDRICDVLSELDTVLNHIPGLLNDNSDLPMMAPNESASGYSHSQILQDIPAGASQFSFRDTSLYLNFNRPSSMMYNKQDFDKNSNNNDENNRMRTTHQQYTNRQGDDYDSPYESHLNHSSTPYSNQGQHHLQNGNQISSVQHQVQDLSPKTMIKHQLPFGSENEQRAISDNSPVDHHTLHNMNSNMDNIHVTHTSKTHNISPTNNDGIKSDLKSDKEERK
ncbi:uncharacterized protein AC631_01412 [Debaryomyces fabryi]|uniref:Zn(2)-C6 fungal-type domain-containing protein n=1 Tax=Debaryomyces fabryi TaxID=58627 RepID=A0A0V1Q3Q4_9ASCO|nr:uncharacterized protein AC631_01412 [Debaryomyces fabryi]KSA02815.1 hypothetical protein AC631_01412 [Debaryomyces fabryi]CUM46108.1 unnamed protein product [Debaryomyces fabryi]